MTAISIVSAILERLKYFLNDLNPNNPNPTLLEELNDEVGIMQIELEKAKKVLIEAENNRKENDEIPKAEKDIIEQFYLCEDAIEKHAQESSERTRFRNPLRNNKKNVQKTIRNLTMRIQELSESCKATRKLKQTTSGGDHNVTHGVLQKNHSVVMPKLTKIQTEGLIDMEQKIKHDLDGDDRDLPIISIWGPGGSGKTTLAKKMYEEAKTACSFDSFAWLYIPFGSETKSILMALLMQLCVQCKEDIEEMDDIELAQMLYKVVQQKKCLIVMDDMRSLDVWQSIRIAFPFRETDSKVLLTTRRKDVAEEAASTERAYNMKSLTTEESWELFKKKAQCDEGLPEAMMALGKEIIKHCDGSPLAVAITGESLKTKIFDEWQRVLNLLQNTKVESFEHKLMEILALSYCRLPHYLKTCFLYLGHFPDDQDIRVETLYLLWMAEGIVPLNDTRKLEKMDTAESYLYELAERSLLEMEEEEEPKFRKFKSCRLHDLIRDLSVTKGKDEEFFETMGNENGSKTSTTPRLAIHLNKYEDGGCSFDKSNVRTLLLFDTHESKSSWPHELSDLKDFELLRILHFDGVDFKARKLQKGLDKLAYLRYLSFLGCDLDKLPTSISNLPYLHTLDLRVRGKMTIPNVLSKMKRLRHLYFPVMYVTEGTGKLSLDGLNELEILENFDTRVCNAFDLANFNKLRILKIIAEGIIKDLEVIIKCMDDNSSRLQLSFLDLRNFDCYSNERLTFIKTLPSLVALHILHVQGYLGNFPEKLHFSKHFIELALDGSELKDDPMPILGKLPKLRSLVLSNDAFMGKHMECCESHFPQLRSLKLLHLNYLESWNVNEGSMLRLSSLTIENCCSLMMLPSGLKCIKILKVLKIVSMPAEFEDTIQREYVKERNDDASNGVLQRPTVVFEH